MKLSNPTVVSLALMGLSLADFFHVADGTNSFVVGNAPAVPETEIGYPLFPHIPKLEPCNVDIEYHPKSGASTRTVPPFVVDHCLLDCNSRTIFGNGRDPVLQVINGGVVIDCPIHVGPDDTGIICSKGDCFLLNVKCFGDKDFNECILAKDQASGVFVAGLVATDQNGLHGIRSVAQDASVLVNSSKIQHQRADGILVEKAKEVLVEITDVSFNRLDGLEARFVKANAVAVSSYFNGNGDDGFDIKDADKVLFAASYANRNKKNGMNIGAATRAGTSFVHVVRSEMSENGLATSIDADQSQNGAFLQGPYKVEILKSTANSNKGDGFKISDNHIVHVEASYANQNKADGIDIRNTKQESRITAVQASKNDLVGLRGINAGSIYVESYSAFNQNGQNNIRFGHLNEAGVYISRTSNVYIQYSETNDNIGSGMALVDNGYIEIGYSESRRNGDDGFDVESAGEVTIMYTSNASNNHNDGFRIYKATKLTVDHDVQSYQNGGDGFLIDEVNFGHLSDILAYQNHKNGIYASETKTLNISATNMVFNGRDGLFVDSGLLANGDVTVNVDDSISCENGDDGMLFLQGSGRSSFRFATKDSFSCDNHQLDLQFDGHFVIDPRFNTVTADLCADKNGNIDVQACKDLHLLPCDKNFVCPSY